MYFEVFSCNPSLFDIYFFRDGPLVLTYCHIYVPNYFRACGSEFLFACISVIPSYFPVDFPTNMEELPLKKPIRLYFHSDVVAMQRAFVFWIPCLHSVP